MGIGFSIFHRVKITTLVLERLELYNLSTTTPLVINHVTNRLTSLRRLIPAYKMKNTRKNSKEATQLK
jgi:hypothetical protein